MFCEKGFLGISQNSKENICARVSFLKKEALAQVFSVNFAKFIRTPFFIEHLSRLLLRRIILLYLTNKRNMFKAIKKAFSVMIDTCSILAITVPKKLFSSLFILACSNDYLRLKIPK